MGAVGSSVWKVEKKVSHIYQQTVPNSRLSPAAIRRFHRMWFHYCFRRL
jgi:hypothetical protein